MTDIYGTAGAFAGAVILIALYCVHRIRIRIRIRRQAQECIRRMKASQELLEKMGMRFKK